MEPLDEPDGRETSIDPAALELPSTVAVTIDISQLLRDQAGRQVALDVGKFESADAVTENPGIAPMLGLVSRSVESALGYLELTHIRVLVVLSQKRAMTVAELAALMKMRSRGVARILDSMHDAGWILTASPGRGTSESVTISAQGLELVNTITAQRQREIDSILSRMQDTDRETLARAFNAFAAAAGEPPYTGPRGGFATSG